MSLIDARRRKARALRLTASERLDELARILAAGLRRKG
jgi:hypothetical protein